MISKGTLAKTQVAWRDKLIDSAGDRHLAECVADALTLLIDKDAHLFMVDCNERSLSHRFAVHLQSRLPEWHVDCEYNRDGREPKALKRLNLAGPQAEGTDGSRVFPDIIVHRRGEANNHMVIEFKKSTSSIKRTRDLAKLRAFREELGYRHALFVELVTGQPEAQVAECMWVHQGALPNEALQPAPQKTRRG